MPRPSPPSELRAVLDAIRRIVQALRESSRAAERRLGVSGAQLFVLQTLARERALSLNELTAKTATHQSSVSVVARKLAERGLIERSPSPTDGRRLELAVTAKGRALLRRAPGAAQERLITSVLSLPKARRRLLARGLADLAKGIALSDLRPTMFFENETPSPASTRGHRHARS